MHTPRRNFLIAAAVGALGLGVRSAPAIAKARPRVVIVGGGYGGAACARHLKLWDPRVEVTLIEPGRPVAAALSTMWAGSSRWSRARRTGSGG